MHLFDKEVCKSAIKRHKEYEAFLHSLEDGAVIIDEIEIRSAKKHVLYFLIKSSGVRTPKFEFEITPDNIRILRRIDEMNEAESKDKNERNVNLVFVGNNSGLIATQGDATQSNVNTQKKTGSDKPKGVVANIMKAIFGAVVGYWKNDN